MLLTSIKYLLFATLFTSFDCKLINNVLYKQISHRFDGILLTISELVGRIEALETREGEKKSDICGPCGNQNTDVGTSVKGDGLKEEFVILMRAFVAEKENLRNSVELIEHNMETKMSVCIETVTELKQKISQLENEKADNKRVGTVEKTLNSVQSSANDLRSRTELIESRITEIQDSSSKIESRLGGVETNVSTVMETMKRKVSFTAQFRIESSSSMQLTKNRIIPFNHVFYNDGDGFDVTSGVFNVPISGVYMFIFFVESFQPKESNTCLGAFVKLYVDGVYAKMSAIADPNYQQHIQAGNSYINYFTKGQRVLIQTAEKCQTSYIGDFRTTFSGLLLY